MEIKEIKTQKILSPTQINLGDYVINPYKGCEFGCSYCYVQKNKNIKSKNKDWGEFVEVKINSPDILEKEIITKKPKKVLIGSTTECCQYLEKRYGLTKKILKILNKNSISYTILTKSSLIKDYLDIISQNKKNKIYFTFNVSQQKYIDMLERKSPSIEKRLETIKEIIKHKINIRIHAGPFIPYISSLENILDILPSGVKEFDVELYHKKMGNFKIILEQIKKVPEQEKAAQIKKVYLTKESYYKYAGKLKDRIKLISRNTGIKFYFIVPVYEEFYKSDINYFNELT